MLINEKTKIAKLLKENPEALEEGVKALYGYALPEDMRVTFLVDMSGSMQGRPLSEVSYGVLAASLALEDMGADVEILGYTTSATNRPAKEFQKDRVTRYPGRLSEALNIVVKASGTSTANHIGSVLAMGMHGINKENLDGEAIAWATERLLKRSGDSNHLVLVTDGFEPHCAATERFSPDGDGLKAHLKALVDELNGNPRLEFSQVVLAAPYQVARQDTYANPVIAEGTAESVATAIVQVLGAGLTPRVAPEAPSHEAVP